MTGKRELPSILMLSLFGPIEWRGLMLFSSSSPRANLNLNICTERLSTEKESVQGGFEIILLKSPQSLLDNAVINNENMDYAN